MATLTVQTVHVTKVLFRKVFKRMYLDLNGSCNNSMFVGSQGVDMKNI